MSRNSFSRLKKVLLLGSIFISFFYSISPTRADQIAPALEQINQYDTDITINKTGSVDVIETIYYDFDRNQKHGIFRDIPIVYRNDDGTYYIPKFTVTSVTDEEGVPYKYEVTPQEGKLDIRIGSADVLVTGEKTYVLKYHAEGVISYFPTSTEFYWNAIGTDWQVPILENHIHVTAPSTITSSTCYSGEQFSTSTACTITTSKKKNSATFTYPAELGPYEGVTIVMAFPTSSIDKPDLSQFVTSTSPYYTGTTYPLDEYLTNPPPDLSPWWWTLPVATIIACFLLWWFFGKEEKVRGVIIAEYEPPEDFSPIEVGTVVDGRVDNRDISALIVDLAVHGYLKIKEVENHDYLFTKMKKADGLSDTCEQKIYNELFKKRDEIRLSALKYKFYPTSNEIKRHVTTVLTQGGYLRPFPYKRVGSFGCFGVLGMTALFIAIGFLTPLGAGDVGVAWIVSLPIMLIGTATMGRHLTKKGAETREHILGFKLFLSVTEADRLKFHNAPEKKPELFEKFLPFAMALGVERQWAKQFEGLYAAPPIWYEGSYVGGFTSTSFTDHLSAFSSTSSTVLTKVVSSGLAGSSGGSSYTPSTPSSSSGFSSGGSSGGGFGGGGGSSW